MALASHDWKQEYLKSRAEVKSLKAELGKLRANSEAEVNLSEIYAEIAVLRENVKLLTELVRKIAPADKYTMEDDPVFEKVREVLAKHLNLDKDKIGTGSDINTDDDAFKAVIKELEEYSGVEIPRDDYKNFSAVSDIVVYINTGKTSKRDANKDTEDNDKPGAVNFATVTTVIQNKTGVHARAAFRFVKTASTFKSKITISSKGATVDAKNMLMIMSVGLAYGAEITINADGPDAKDAVSTLKKLIDDKLGEE